MTIADAGTWHEERVMSTPVSGSDIRRFALALEDPDPTWRGEQALAPPTYILSAMRPELEDGLPAEDGSLPTTVPGSTLGQGRRILNAGCELSLEMDLRAGDVVSSTSELVSHENKQGASGPLDIVVVRTTYSCERGLLATSLQSLVLR